MPTFVVHTPVGVNQIHIRKAIREAVAEATRLGKLRPNSVDSITGKNSGNNLGAGDSGDALRAVGRGRDRGQADPQGRRLREHEHAVFGALRAGPPGPRGPQPGRRAQVHPARGVEGAGAGMRAGSAGRVHRQRPRARLRTGQGAAFPHAGRRESRPDAGQAGSRDHGRGQQAGRGRHGIRREGVADRLQDHGGEPAAGQLLRVGGIRLLGVPPAGRAAGRGDAARSRAGCIAIRRARWSAWRAARASR